ncbi:FAD-binding oxidoreductase, partial [Streptomyces sp. NPDC060131]
MHRRTFLTTTTAAALAATTTACTGKDQPPGTDSKGTATGTRTALTSAGSATPTPTPTPKAPATWTALAKSLDGPLIRPGDRTWTTAHQLYNTRFDTLKPTAVAYAAHPDDIRTALSYARAHRIPVAIRNGGHSYAGWSSGDGRLIIDVSTLNRVRASAGEAVVGAGAKLIDVYRALAAKGVTVPAGSCPTVGISGLTLGGGHGVVSRAYGLTCDSLTRATLITADGKEITADATGAHKDLFWALRGAGNGNFGIVTEFRFRTHPAPRAVSAYLSWPWRKAAAVVRAWQEWGPDQPDEIWSSLHLAAAPGRTPT